MKTQKEKIKKGKRLTKLYMGFPYEMGSYEDELKVQEAINYGYNAGKSEAIKQIDILYNKIKREYNEEHKIMMEVKGKDNARYYRQYAVCGQLAYGMVKLEELKEILEGELAK